jgi:hypothetical protein
MIKIKQTAKKRCEAASCKLQATGILQRSNHLLYLRLSVNDKHQATVVLMPDAYIFFTRIYDLAG